nr:NAD(P)/FAD-dependent oxidoreductase [Actinocatenispora thailandica]
MTETRNDGYDVVVIGGGAAGLSGALMLVRSRRSVLVIDAGQPRNAPADGVHGLLGREGMPPGELLARGRDEVRGYGGEVVSGTVESATRDGAGFAVRLAGGGTVRARRLLVTTGLVDELPDIPGLRERWGREVVHCPYCHGYEVRDQAIGVLGTGPMSVHQAALFAQLSSDVVYFAQDAPAPAGEAAERLAALGVPVLAGAVTAAEVVDDRLVGLRLADGTLVRRDAIVLATRMVARAGFLGALGLRPVPHPSGFGEHLPVDATGRTEVPGVWAAGNVTDLSAQVGAAAAAGALAGAQINADLVDERLREAVAAHRSGFSAATEAAVSERVLGDRRHGLVH